jgi:hypothetical protein
MCPQVGNLLADPPSIDELSEATKLELGQTQAASARQFEDMTGHLLFVDKNTQIHVSYQTMAAFLTKQRDGFWIDKAMSHSRLAEVSLKFLSGNDFSYDLMHCKSADDGTIIALNKLLRSNVLTWIERVAATGELSSLQLASQRFISYLRRLAKYQSPLSLQAQTVSAWTVDIHHLIATFHPSLLFSPSSTHLAIPHLCPPK